jgi:CRP/FNR family cyclic AMP-dependent transcriptional regulator
MTSHDLFAALAAASQKLTLTEAIGYAGVVLCIVTSLMRTMVPLRALSIVTNLVFLAYGILNGIVPTILVNTILLPLNGLRLVEMLRLTREVRRAANADLSLEWLKPFMQRRTVAAGQLLFMKGEEADCLYYTLSGRYVLRESGLAIGQNQLVGELGFVAPDHCRTQTLECLEPGIVLTISYDELRQLYFQNPEFGFYFLSLTSGRLIQNLAAAERQVAGLRGRVREVGRRAA